jgi:hypothetical protein
MPKLKLGAILDDKPVKLAVELSAQVHRDLTAYAELLSRETAQMVEPAKLVAPMIERFMATDRAFSRSRRERRKFAPPNSMPSTSPATRSQYDAHDRSNSST